MELWDGTWGSEFGEWVMLAGRQTGHSFVLTGVDGT